MEVGNHAVDGCKSLVGDVDVGFRLQGARWGDAGLIDSRARRMSSIERTEVVPTAIHRLRAFSSAKALAEIIPFMYIAFLNILDLLGEGADADL